MPYCLLALDYFRIYVLPETNEGEIWKAVFCERNRGKNNLVPEMTLCSHMNYIYKDVTTAKHHFPITFPPLLALRCFYAEFRSPSNILFDAL